jgi:hypothetical protein
MTTTRVNVLDLNETPFDENIRKFYRGKWIDFRKQDMTWYYNEWSNILHPKSIRGNIDGVVDPATLIYCAEQIFDELSKNSGLILDDDPINAKQTIDRYLQNDIEKIQMIVMNLEEFIINRDVSSAWEYLRGGSRRFTTDTPNYLAKHKDYIEFALFIYIVGISGHELQWII